MFLNQHSIYKKATNILICCFYSFLILFSAFHYHTFEFNSVKAFEQSNENVNEQMLWQAGIGAECFIHLNFVSLQTVIVSSFPHFKIFEPANTAFNSPVINCPLLFNHQKIIKLRAPPKIS